jgi:hypothetical protein
MPLHVLLLAPVFHGITGVYKICRFAILLAPVFHGITGVYKVCRFATDNLSTDPL